MPLNANAARSTFACCRWFLRLQLLLSLLLLPFVAPQLHATPTENGSERERRLGHYIQAFLCGISWHFSVRRQLLPVSVTVSVTHFHSSSHLSLSLSLLSLCFVCFSRAQNVPTFCYWCPWRSSISSNECNLWRVLFLSYISIANTLPIDTRMCVCVYVCVSGCMCGRVVCPVLPV